MNGSLQSLSLYYDTVSRLIRLHIFLLIYKLHQRVETKRDNEEISRLHMVEARLTGD
jgi:hypothetical protein